MALRWKYEPWRKLYLREEGSFAALPLMTRALAGELIKFADDNGRIHLGGKEPWDAIAMQGGADRNDRLVLRRHIQALLDDGYLVLKDGALWVRNLANAQRRFDKVPATPEQDNDKTEAEPRQDSDKASTEPKQDLDKTSTEPTEVTPAHDTTSFRSDVTIREEKREERKEGRRAAARNLSLAAVEHLNQKLGTRHSPIAKPTLEAFEILAREGYTADQARLAIDAKIAEWGGNEQMRPNLKPSCLFRPVNFRRYVADTEGGQPTLLPKPPPARGFGGKSQPEPPTYVDEGYQR